jgi:hypothetical protein
MGVLHRRDGRRIVRLGRFSGLIHEGGAAMAKKQTKTKTQRALKTAFREVKRNPPKLTAKGKTKRQKQKVAIALSKARKAGARIPKKRK